MEGILNESDPPRRVLIIRLSALGDVLHCLPAFAALRELWPEARFDWITESLSAPILEGHPGLSRVLPLPRKEWRRMLLKGSEIDDLQTGLESFSRDVRDRYYDLIIDFQGNLRSLSTALVARCGRRIGHHASETKELSWLLPALRPATPAGRVHRVEKNLHLVRALGWRGSTPTVGMTDLGLERARLVDQGVGTEAPPVLIHPFVSPFGRFKEWPAEFFARLARDLAERGQRVLISWAPAERARAQSICDGAGAGSSLAPATSNIRELAALISLGRVFIGADTGALHLATLLGTPVVGLYGPKDPTRYGPWTRRSRVLSASVPCSPCTLRCCDHAICMQALPPQDVTRAALDLMEEWSPG